MATLSRPADPMMNLIRQMTIWCEMRRMFHGAEGCPHPYLGAEDFVLRHGHPFRRSTRRSAIRPVPTICFQHSYALAVRKGSPWVYCEGFAVPPIGLAVHHAWVMRSTAPDDAVEVAWMEGTPEDTAYFGIPFRADFVRETFVSSKRREYSVLNTPWSHYPLFTGKTKIEDVIWRNE